MRHAFRSVAALNVVVALWLTTMFLILRHPGFEQNAAQAAAIAAFCAFAFFAAQTTATAWMRIAALIGSVALAGLDGWAIYLDVQPDASFEGFILIVGALWIVQGALSVVYASAGAAPAVGPIA